MATLFAAVCSMTLLREFSKLLGIQINKRMVSFSIPCSESSTARSRRKEIAAPHSQSITPFLHAGSLDVDLLNTRNGAGNSLHFPDQIRVLQDLGADANGNGAIAYEYLDLGFDLEQGRFDFGFQHQVFHCLLRLKGRPESFQSCRMAD